ncbi:MAG: staphylolytic protease PREPROENZYME LASA [Rhodobacterales bacterium]|nr:MAG: staphylolytic protease PREPROENZYME LASA [Rhodobacterales bacterium]
MDQILHPVARVEDPAEAIAALAARYRRANGPVMRLVTKLGGSLESQMALVPVSLREQMERTVARALEASYGLAGRAPDLGDRGGPAAVMAPGAAGGAGGIATSLAELPVTVTLILNTIRAAAVEAGLDPAEPWVQAECLRVFGAGSPLSGDDGINTSFLTARLTITGAAVQNLITTIAPKLALVLGQKLAAQAVPVLGAVTGAALNAAFLSYYREVARIRFALLRLAEVHGTEAVLEAFARAVEPPKITQA